MPSVFVYGSLLNTEELKSQFGGSVETCKAVLNGFKRHYGQLSDVRTDENGDYGNVLTVTRKEGFSCNGILVSGVSDEKLAELRERESGYRLERMTSGRVETYREDIEAGSFLVSIGEKETTNWNPLNEYMETCEKGARARGEKFHQVFRKSTYRFADSDIRPHL
ncbi:MAG: cation transport regulator ChaC [Candidatus Nanohaloarchaea archaeon]|jgi:cation transport regulator ChaC